ncbi:MAG: hypothetical protein ACK5IM_15030 [Demequina sp.]|uniref:hypothetical protein n=1 Tax=Demequina sp. TaxID=2050685 RepID=UPI003A84EBEC
MNLTRPLRMTAIIAAMGLVAAVGSGTTDVAAADQGLADAALPSGVATTAVHRTDTQTDVTSASASGTTDLASAALTGTADASGTPQGPAAGIWMPHRAAAYLTDPLTVTTQANVRERVRT